MTYCLRLCLAQVLIGFDSAANGCRDARGAVDGAGRGLVVLDRGHRGTNAPAFTPGVRVWSDRTRTTSRYVGRGYDWSLADVGWSAFGLARCGFAIASGPGGAVRPCSGAERQRAFEFPAGPGVTITAIRLTLRIRIVCRCESDTSLKYQYKYCSLRGFGILVCMLAAGPVSGTSGRCGGEFDGLGRGLRR